MLTVEVYYNGRIEISIIKGKSTWGRTNQTQHPDVLGWSQREYLTPSAMMCSVTEQEAVLSLRIRILLWFTQSGRLY